MNNNIPKESKEQINKILDLCKSKLKENLVYANEKVMKNLEEKKYV
jgi:hypothetical protein